MDHRPRLGPPLRPRATAHATLQRPLRGHPAQPALLQAPDGRQGGQGLYLPPQALQPQHADSGPADPRTPPAAPHRRPATTPTRERRRVRFDLTPQPAAADSGTVFPAQPGRFFERPEEATKSPYPAENAGRPPTSHTASCPLAATKKLEDLCGEPHLCGQLPINRRQIRFIVL